MIKLWPNMKIDTDVLRGLVLGLNSDLHESVDGV